MKVTPVSETKPTQRALARGVNQLHRCLEDHRTTSERTLRRHGDELREIKEALGIGEHPKRTVATMRPWVALVQQMAAVAGGGAGVIFIYKLAVAAWPAVAAFVAAINHAILTTS